MAGSGCGASSQNQALVSVVAPCLITMVFFSINDFEREEWSGFDMKDERLSNTLMEADARWANNDGLD